MSDWHTGRGVAWLWPEAPSFIIWWAALCLKCDNYCITDEITETWFNRWLQTVWRHWGVGRAETALKVFHPILVVLSVAHVKCVWLSGAHSHPWLSITAPHRRATVVTAATKTSVRDQSLAPMPLGYYIYQKVEELPYCTLKSAGIQGETAPPSDRKHVLQRTYELCLGPKFIFFEGWIFWVWVLTSTQPCNLMQMWEDNTVTVFRWWGVMHFWKG